LGNARAAQVLAATATDVAPRVPHAKEAGKP
jgi:hypothetical protein